MHRAKQMQQEASALACSGKVCTSAALLYATQQARLQPSLKASTRQQAKAKGKEI
jgi:hypothetical protein